MTYYIYTYHRPIRIVLLKFTVLYIPVLSQVNKTPLSSFCSLYSLHPRYTLYHIGSLSQYILKIFPYYVHYIPVTVLIVESPYPHYMVWLISFNLGYSKITFHECNRLLSHFSVPVTYNTNQNHIIFSNYIS